VCDDAKRFVSTGGAQSEADTCAISSASESCSAVVCAGRCPQVLFCNKIDLQALARLRAVQKLLSQLVGADASARMADLFVAVRCECTG
jgi:hypothetical protein